MRFDGESNQRYAYIMISAVLKEITEEKDLGVWMSDSLQSKRHVAQVVSKANKILGLIRLAFKFLDCRLMKQLFTALVRPHLHYGNLVWHPQLNDM